MFINNNLNKGISTPIAILIIMVAAVIGGGLVLWQYSEMEKETDNVSETEDTKIDTSDWKIYTNEEYGFEIKYPKEWNYGPNMLREPPNITFCPPELIDSDPDLGCKWESIKGHKPNSLSPIWLFAYKQNFPSKTEGKGYWKNPTGDILYILKLSDNFYQEIYDQMLSSFKFIE